MNAANKSRDNELSACASGYQNIPVHCAGNCSFSALDTRNSFDESMIAL